MKLLVAYRALAYITGVLLVILTVGSVLKYGTTNGTEPQLLGEDIVHTVGIAHGWLYMVYVIVTLFLSLREKWSIRMTILVALAGTVPFAAFFAEPRVVARAKASRNANEAAAPEGATTSS